MGARQSSSHFPTMQLFSNMSKVNTATGKHFYVSLQGNNPTYTSSVIKAGLVLQFKPPSVSNITFLPRASVTWMHISKLPAWKKDTSFLSCLLVTYSTIPSSRLRESPGDSLLWNLMSHKLVCWDSVPLRPVNVNSCVALQTLMQPALCFPTVCYSTAMMNSLKRKMTTAMFPWTAEIFPCNWLFFTISSFSTSYFPVCTMCFTRTIATLHNTRFI